MKRIPLALVIVLALLVATIPIWYSPPGGDTLILKGVLKDVGTRTIVVTTESGEIVLELRGEYSGGLKWHQVIEELRAHIGEEIRVKAEYRGRSLVAIALEIPKRGVKF